MSAVATSQLEDDAMNPHVQWRLDFARTLSARLHGFAGLEAMAVGGSVARGYSDRYSDIELLLFWNEAPDDDVRQAVMRRWQAEFRHPPFDPGHSSSLRVQGIPVDVWHLTSAGQEADMHTVLHEHSIDLVANNRMETVRDCIPFYGVARIQHWQAVIQAYPAELAHCFLQAYISHFHLRQLHLAARRDNPTTLYHTLTDIQCSLFIVLLALNKAYFPTFKWMYHTLAKLPLGPPQIAGRLQQMFHEPPLQAVAQLRTVLAETLAIVETHYPQLDTAYARYGLDQEPGAYDSPPLIC